MVGEEKEEKHEKGGEGRRPEKRSTRRNDKEQSEEEKQYNDNRIVALRRQAWTNIACWGATFDFSSASRKHAGNVVSG